MTGAESVERRSAWDNKTEDNENEWKEGDDSKAGRSVFLDIMVDPVDVGV